MRRSPATMTACNGATGRNRDLFSFIITPGYLLNHLLFQEVVGRYLQELRKSA
ncbi:hypothetical protein NR798_35360 [Archangium gephyra]|uniref:hypothetical protein n=1 Tax=Archangium gephyra TaxID=48 RepID=UPI0035D441F6